MNLFRKFPFAVFLSCLIVVLSLALGQVKYMEQTGRLPGGQNHASLDSSLDTTLSTAAVDPFISDPEHLLSSEAKTQISRYNANMQTKYGSLVAVVALSRVTDDIDDAAYDAMERFSLSGKDALLLLSMDNREAYLAVGDAFFPQWGHTDIADFLERSLYPEYRQGNSTEAVRSFFAATYAAFSRAAAATQSGTGFSSVSFWTSLPALFFLALVVFVCTIVDNVRYSQYFRRFGGMNNPPIAFRPVLFWHGPNSHWFLRRQQKKPPQDERFDDTPPGGFSGFSGGFGGFGSQGRGKSR